MRARNGSFSGMTLGLLVAFAGALAEGQGLVQSQGEVVAATGDLITGQVVGFGIAVNMDAPVMQDDGRLLFRTQLFQNGSVLPSTTDRALVYGDTKAGMTMVSRYGDPEPSGTIPGAVVYQIVSSYSISSNGLMFFSSLVSGPGITFSNDSVLYAGTPGNFQVVAREGSPAADCPAGTIYTPDTSNFGLTSGALNINASGRVAFRSLLSGTLTGDALFSGLPGSLVRVITKNEVLPSGLTVANFGTPVQMNPAGQILLDSVSYPGTVNNNSVWIYTPGAGKQQILREGDSAPVSGTTFADPISLGSSDKCNFNASGHALMLVGLASTIPGVVTAGVNDLALVIVSASGHSLVARKNSPAPGIPNTTLQFTTGLTLRLNDGGQVSFCSQIAGAGVSPSNDTALWIGTPGSLTLVAREGDVAPGTGGSTFGDMCGQKLMNDAGQLIFNNQLVGGGTPGTSLWSWDPVLGLQPVALIGDVVQVKPGNFQTFVGGAGLLTSYLANGASRPLAFADDGTLVGRATFINTLGAMIKVRIGSLTGIPKALSAAGGGVHTLHLDAGFSHAGETYVVVGSVSGTSPGVPIGPFLVPLNFDLYTNLMLMQPNAAPFGNTLGVLSPVGRATATLTIPPGVPGIAGIVAHHAFGAVNASNAITFVSEPSVLTIAP